MPVSADTLAILISKGLAGDDLIEVVRAIDDDMCHALPVDAPASDKRSPGARRQHLYRLRRAQILTESDVTRDVCDVTSDVTHTPSSLPQRDNNQTPTHHPKSSLRSDKREIEIEFDEKFWPAWPNKVGRPVALKAFAKARSKHSLETIMLGLARYVAGKPSDRPWLNPATFLNQERFMDSPAAEGAVSTSHVTLTPSGIFVKAETPQWDAWDRHYRQTKGRGPPTNKDGGWYFPSEFPPEQDGPMH